MPKTETQLDPELLKLSSQDSDIDSNISSDSQDFESTDESQTQSATATKAIANKSILSTFSFLNLSSHHQEIVRQFVARKTQRGVRLNDDELIDEIVDSFRNRKLLQNAVIYHQRHILETDPVQFQYLSFEAQNAKENELLLSYYVLYKQFEVEFTQEPLSNKSKMLLSQLQRTVFLLAQLRKLQVSNPLQRMHINSTMGYENVVFPMCLALAEQSNFDISIWNIFSDNLEQSINFMNWERIAWLFGNASLGIIVNDIYQQNTQKNTRSQELLQEPKEASGVASVLFYEVRLLLNIRSLLKHLYIPAISIGSFTIKEDPLNLLNPQELAVRRKLYELDKAKSLTKEEKFNPELDNKKYVLANDIVWGMANLACYVWFNYKIHAAQFGIAFGLWGDLITIALFCMDLSIAILKYIDEREKYNAEMQIYDKQIKALEAKIEFIKNLNPEVNPDEPGNIDNINIIVAMQEDITILEEQLQKLLTAKAKRQRERELKFKEITAGILYALGLVTGYSLMTFLAFSPVGVFSCFIFTFFFMLSTDVLAIKAHEKEYSILKNSLAEKLNEISGLKDTDSDKKKELIVEVYHLNNKLLAQQEIIKASYIKTGLGLLVNLVVPACVLLFVLFPPVSAPLALALGIVIWSLAYIVPATWKYVSNKYIDNLGYALEQTTESEIEHYVKEFNLEAELSQLHELENPEVSSNLFDWFKLSDDPHDMSDDSNLRESSITCY